MNTFAYAAIVLAIVLGIVGVLAIGAWLAMQGERWFAVFVILVGVSVVGSIRVGVSK